MCYLKWSFWWITTDKKCFLPYIYIHIYITAPLQLCNINYVVIAQAGNPSLTWALFEDFLDLSGKDTPNADT